MVCVFSLGDKLDKFGAGYWFGRGFKDGTRELSKALVSSSDLSCDFAFSVCVGFSH